MTARISSYSHDGLEFGVVDAGPVDGPVVVLLHGFPQRASSWEQVAPLLHAAGCRTLAPDQRGYAEGARPRRRRDYRLSLLAGDVAALVERSGGRAHLVGHDWGAAVAWALAVGRPDLVTSLTSVSVPHPGAMARSLLTRDQRRRSWYLAAFQLPVLPERVLSSPRAEVELAKGGMPPEARDRYRREIVGSGALRGALHWYRAMLLERPGLLRTPVRVPTTHVWSDRDVALGRRGAELTAAYVDAPYRLEVLAGVSHWIPDEAPEALAAIILDRVRSVG